MFLIFIVLHFVRVFFFLVLSIVLQCIAHRYDGLRFWSAVLIHFFSRAVVNGKKCATEASTSIFCDNCKRESRGADAPSRNLTNGFKTHFRKVDMQKKVFKFVFRQHCSAFSPYKTKCFAYGNNI